MIKAFIWECMLFQKPWINYGFMPNYILGILSWLNLLVLILGIIGIINN